MTFNVSADAYGRFMGRFSEPLAPLFADAAASGGGSVLDVGCGPGALTRELLRRVDEVVAVDPSPPFVAAARAAYPEVDVLEAVAADLPFTDDRFDAALAQLVVHFMPDPVAGLREMARVTRPGGTVAACVWDHGGGRSPLSRLWRIVTHVDPAARDEGGLPGAAEHDLARLMGEAGLGDVVESDLQVASTFDTFEEWWEPNTFGVGPLGAYVAGLDADRREQLREVCRSELPTSPFTIEAHAWCAVGRVSAAR